jgi:hypothetical protein
MSDNYQSENRVRAIHITTPIIVGETLAVPPITAGGFSEPGLQKML